LYHFESAEFFSDYSILGYETGMYTVQVYYPNVKHLNCQLSKPPLAKESYHVLPQKEMIPHGSTQKSRLLEKKNFSKFTLLVRLYFYINVWIYC
jgi:hypothetical protein